MNNSFDKDRKTVKKLFLPLLLTGLVSLLNLNQVSASYIIQMESDADASAGNELYSITYDSYADILTDTQASSNFSSFDSSSVWSTTGLAYDGVKTVSEPSIGIPEPSIIALFTVGLIGIRFARRRQS